MAKSTIGDRGLFAMRKIPADFALYVYTGVKRTSEDAARYPNAYQCDMDDGSVYDAGDASQSSPARWVNSHDRDLCWAGILSEDTEAIQNNCMYAEHKGKLYLITTCSIKPFQELFVAYGRQEQGYPEWRQAFLGDGREQVTKYRKYLMSPPEDATVNEGAQARQLQVWLQIDLDEALDKSVRAHEQARIAASKPPSYSP